ncbi:MAG: hypothetical protein OHK0015_11970 [Chloroflexi bacterium OHK40]
MRELFTPFSGPLRMLRRALGFFFLGVGLLGAALPIIPGWPGFILAILLLGRRDRTLRQLHVLARRSLRALRRAPHPHVRPVGLWLSDQYLTMRRAITPHIIAAERVFG